MFYQQVSLFPIVFLQMTSPTVYRNVLIAQNKFLNDTMTTPIYGMSTDSATKMTKDLRLIKEILEAKPEIIAIYPPTDVQQGKWFVYYRKENKIQVKKLLMRYSPVS